MITYDRIAGVLWGQALGDALGLPAEHRSREWCEKKYPNGGPFRFERVERPSRGEVFEAGAWSDDTDQALILVDSWLEHRAVNPQDIAARLLTWAKTQKGMGSHTRKVLEHPDFATDPYRASRAVWVARDCQAAPNGAVMRSAVCGLFGKTPQETANIAADMAKVTHFDPRCGVSAVIVAVTVHHLIRGMRMDMAMASAQAHAKAYGSMVVADSTIYHDLIKGGGVRVDGDTQGYTFTTLGVATVHAELFALLQPRPEDTKSLFLLTLGKIIREGGDTDTNAAVTGALLGAAVGFDGLPHFDLILHDDIPLIERAEALATMHGLEPTE